MTLCGEGDFTIEVVGESRYQEAIELAAGGRTDGGCEKIVDALLVLEDTNPHDPMAVQVRLNERRCGYLKRVDARIYRSEMMRNEGQPVTVRCKAMIVGGWDRGPDDRGHFGVRLDLDLPPPD